MAVFERTRREAGAEILAGGSGSMEEGYFVKPTLIVSNDLMSSLFTEEFFGPIATVFVYRDEDYSAILDAVDRQSAYGLTGSIFARDRDAIAEAALKLRNTAGNFYVNDKPTGAVVGQQPFGGARASGTDDKAGSIWNLMRWTSPRAIKETLVPATDYRYPFMQ
jgi:1-pyrroline-5-carboxylate dehydrogenase